MAEPIVMRFKIGRANFCELRFDREPTYAELVRLRDYVTVAIDTEPAAVIGVERELAGEGREGGDGT